MFLGIVGSEEAKFTPEAKARALLVIEDLYMDYRPEVIVSGGCHLGGIDIWAAEFGKQHDLGVMEFLPKTKNWEGYKNRNLLIAEYSDVVVCITVKDLPPGFKEGGWERYCYHCKTDAHIKSGGCWTVKEAIKLGKQGKVIVV